MVRGVAVLRCLVVSPEVKNMQKYAVCDVTTISTILFVTIHTTWYVVLQPFAVLLYHLESCKKHVKSHPEDQKFSSDQIVLDQETLDDLYKFLGLISRYAFCSDRNTIGFIKFHRIEISGESGGF